jgi:molecular chaperone HtpG
MATAEKHAFQAEIGQLLEIVTHSLYTDKEIFVRELISNAADASEKLKFMQTSGAEVFQAETPLTITVATDDQAKTITITDAGIGMTRPELIENLGTIAHSGSRAFLERMKANAGDANLIGQFGVGFYSAFMVGDKVTVYTRSYRPEEEGCIWTSDGSGGYEIETAPDLARGTRIVVHLKESESEYAGESRVEQIIKHYSNFVPFPIELNGKPVNTVQALWTKNKSEIQEDDYTEFYKYIAHDTDAPLYKLHFSADAPLAIRALLFVPEKNFELLTMHRAEPEVHLYCRKILIQARAKGLFPEWLRFLRGVVDSEDLPLNISRESMQDSALMRKLNDVLTKKVIRWLDDEAKGDAEKYAKFFAQHGHCLKEGVATDYTHREALAKLLRFASSHTEGGKATSLPDYVGRMPEAQKEIYYLLAASREAAEASPYYEVFRARGYEVLFLTEPRDEFVMDHLANFDGKRLVSAEKADLQIESDQPHALSDDDARLLATFMKETLGARVEEVRVSKRLTGSPAVVLDKDTHMTTSMRRVMKAIQSQSREGGADPEAFETKPDLEINPDHPAIVALEKKRHSDAALAGQVAEQIFDSAMVAAGLLEDPRAMLARINSLLERVLAG